MSSMQPAPMSGQTAGKPSCTAPFTVDQLLAKCGGVIDGNTATWQLVCNYLDTMCNDAVPRQQPTRTLALALSPHPLPHLHPLPHPPKPLPWTPCATTRCAAITSPSPH
eukprot:2509992-Prymnesium_polylepis.1